MDSSTQHYCCIIYTWLGDISAIRRGTLYYRTSFSTFNDKAELPVSILDKGNPRKSSHIMSQTLSIKLMKFLLWSYAAPILATHSNPDWNWPHGLTSWHILGSSSSYLIARGWMAYSHRLDIHCPTKNCPPKSLLSDNEHKQAFHASYILQQRSAFSYFSFLPLVKEISQKCSNRNKQKSDVEIECTHQDIYDPKDILLQ